MILALLLTWTALSVAVALVAGKVIRFGGGE
jgi:hypothetical protein